MIIMILNCRSSVSGLQVADFQFFYSHWADIGMEFITYSTHSQ